MAGMGDEDWRLMELSQGRVQRLISSNDASGRLSKY
jgi:hypothetical protein